MRATWMSVGISAGIMGLSVIAGASPNLQFETVINQGDAIAGDQFGAAGQVVAGPNGTVGIVGILENSGNSIVIYSTPGAGDTWNNQTVAVGGTPYTIPSIPDTENFIYFDNLAITGNPSNGTRLSFDAQDENDNSGILQWDGTSLQDVAFDGDSKGYSSVGGDGLDSGGPLLEMQVNGTGQAMFPAVASTKNVIVRGDYTSLSTIFTPSGSLSDTDTGSRVALGADNSGTALLSSSGTPGIYTIPANGSTPV